VYNNGSKTSEDAYKYDRRGNILGERHNVAGVSKEFVYTYDSMNRVKTIKYPDGEIVTNTYGNGGNLNTVGGNSSYVTNLNYNEFNKVKDLTYGNGAVNYYDYYDTGSEYDNSAGTYYSYRLRRIYTNPLSICNIQYRYDKAGNVKNKIDSNNSGYTESYGYDALNRLTSANGYYGNNSYDYNRIGNIKAKDGVDYYYDSPRPHAVTSTSDGTTTKTYLYDENGNMKSKSDGSGGSGMIFNYDTENRLISADSAQYTYGPGEGRVKKVENGVTIRYFNAYYEEEDSNKIKYYYANGQRVAKRSTDEGLVYYHQDHLGSSSKMTNPSKTVVKTIGYKPYGDDAYSSGNASLYYKFTGQEQDSTGLYYYGARYYDPELARFISVDAAGDDYCYCNNNPVKYVDPTGNTPEEFQLGYLLPTGADIQRSAWQMKIALSPIGWGTRNILGPTGRSMAENPRLTIMTTLAAIPVANSKTVSHGIKVALTELLQNRAGPRVVEYLPAIVQNIQNSAVLSAYLQYTLTGDISLGQMGIDGLMGGATLIPLRYAKHGGNLGPTVEKAVARLANSKSYRKYIGRSQTVEQNKTAINTFLAGSLTEIPVTLGREWYVQGGISTDSLYAYLTGRGCGFMSINVTHS